MLDLGYERGESAKCDHTIENVYGAGQNPVLPQGALANVTQFKRFKPSRLPNELGNRLNYFLARKRGIKFDMLQASKAIKILNEGFEKRKLLRNLLTELLIANDIFGQAQIPILSSYRVVGLMTQLNRLEAIGIKVNKHCLVFQVQFWNENEAAINIVIFVCEELWGSV